MKHTPIPIGHIHDSFCRCRACKPPIPTLSSDFEDDPARSTRWALWMPVALAIWVGFIALLVR